MTASHCFDPISKKFPRMFHGGDYNPDQWLHVPGVIDEDFRLFKIAGLNSASVGIFAWSALEPEEGRFEFGWLDDIMDRAAKDNMGIILATPSGSKPHWMAQKYPEICRMYSPDNNRFLEPVRQEAAFRHNHCPSSEIYLEKCLVMNTKLAERYKDHPALAMWHVSNEYNTGCECPRCRAKFRAWLKVRYGSLDALNKAWWTAFWSHTYTDWEQVGAVDWTVTSMVLDWRRFSSDNMLDFFVAESAPLRSVTPEIPLTANMMGTFVLLDYWKWAPHIDVITWDAYPSYHDRPDTVTNTAPYFSMVHDLNRSFKGGKPFLMIESSPGPTNWQGTPRQNRPGVHKMKSLQAVAHGSDGVCYFQMRKGRGGSEQFHGAVIDHIGSEDNRTFREVAALGKDLQKLADLAGAGTPARVGIVFDWESWWALTAAKGPTAFVKDLPKIVTRHYRAFWELGIPVDMLNEDCALDGYDLVVAPQLYMVRDGFGARVEKFVADGGTFVATCLSGIVNDSDLVFTGGLPGPLRNVLGILSEETDYLYDDERNTVEFPPDETGFLGGAYEVSMICDVIRAETATVEAVYGRDYYRGKPALTRNAFGKGAAWYIAANSADDTLLFDFYGKLAKTLDLAPALPGVALPCGVTAQLRQTKDADYIFVTNYNHFPVSTTFDQPYTDLLTDAVYAGTAELAPYASLVFKHARQ